MARILIVDDEPGVLRTVGRMVERMGHRPVVVSGGRAALDKVRLERFDTVLIDLMMPQMDGIETIRELRKLCPELPLVAMSGGGSLGLMDYLEMAAKLGAVATIEKPIEVPKLRSVLLEILRPDP